MICPVTSTAEALADGSMYVPAGVVMVPGAFYQFACSVASWVKQGAAPTAAAADGSMYVPAGVVLTLDGTAGAALSVIRASGDGTASLTRCKVI